MQKSISFKNQIGVINKGLEIYKFMEENQVERQWRGDILCTWVEYYYLQEFTKMVRTALDDGGIDCILQPDGIICIDLVKICDYYGIDPEEIEPKD